MFKHIMIKGALLLAAPAVAVLAFATGASATSTIKVSFSASHDGASAGWSAGKGSPIDLTVGNTPGTFAIVTLTHLPTVAVSHLAEPTFTTDNYNAGSPRYYITLSDGDTLKGYPANSGLNGTDMAWELNNSNIYVSWSVIQIAEGTATVTGVQVIADGDQTAGTTDVITNLQFDGHAFN